MKKKLIALILTLALILPMIPAGSVYAMGDTPEFYGTSLTLENNIAINFVIDAEAFADADFSEPQVTFSFKGNSRTETRYTEKNGYWYFTFRDITARDMNEVVTATVSAEKGGVRVAGETITESVVSYCRKALFAYSTSNPTLCTMIVDLLNYGAKSQVYFDYDTAHLANAKLTPSQLAMGTATTPTATSCSDSAYVERPGSDLTWYSANLKLADSVNLQFFFVADDVSDITVEVHDESNDLVASFTGDTIEKAGNYWRVCCDTLTPDQMRDKLFVTAIRDTSGVMIGEKELPFVELDGNKVSNTLRYSIESYVADAMVQYDDLELNALLDAMLNYGDSVSAYVAETNAFKVNTPTLRSQLDAIPVAMPDNTDDELRQIVLDYYALQASVPWVTRDAFTYVYNPGSTKDMAANTIYCGMPYSSVAVGLYKFLDYYNEDTGVLNNVWGNDMGYYSYYNATPNGVGLGNNCSSSIYWAWARISTTITFSETKNMTPAKGVYPVGNYTIDTEKEIFEDNYDSNDDPVEGAYNTRSICDENGLTKMSQAYAKLKPGDAVVSYNEYLSGSTVIKRHHTRIVKKVNVVMTSGGGMINASKSTIHFYEQDSSLSEFSLNGQTAHNFSKGVVGNYSEKSFDNLFSTGYIPVTCAELLHDCNYPQYEHAAVQNATATLNSNPPSSTNLTTIGGKTLTTNYNMAKITLTAEDASGDMAARVCEYRRLFNGTDKERGLTWLSNQLKEELYAGSYTVYLDVLLSNGETLRVGSWDITKS